ncbi:response regulator [Roseobacter sp. HKCCD9010]|uniref:ATP-binding protein n=1 Tax=unclassified Roseobacter TaxID=196798 RepID=UPI001490ED96|nr:MULTISPECIES: ATP-binding protein [unclassified Roseobacter]NNV17136.1 response regulator [Roseobacter sp. HKCCD8768]NNV26365.1 response regulator [Roseobacter sp. HKCCD8192]NNV35124.1 response regulator [Roseobacter sp. HKCCD9073]NNV73340.1 response regulator [Roseobacter sp. HKCCD5932]NNV77014.1 response regulator [Roseobacter sp. HKCCD6135]NNV98983.1 response regulator [Roseobacter sp. HKCCD6505]NNW07263.1 response regulator [Roseobacter sp. HKCCD8431]NNW15776.1 response regulator [Ro
MILILSAMGLLAVMVGVAAVVVNRYVIQSHDTLIQSNLPRIQLASEIGADVEFVGTVSTAFVRADTRADLDRMVARLGDAVDRIEAGVRLLEDGEGADDPADLPTEDSAAEILDRIATVGRQSLELSARVRAEHEALDREGAAFTALVGEEIGLARLRVTATIVGLYTGVDGDLRPVLDDLADEYFFAFERLTELGRLVDGMRLKTQSLPAMMTSARLEETHRALVVQVADAEQRLGFLLSDTARGAAAQHLAAYRAALAPGGLVALQRERVLLADRFVAESRLLNRRITALSNRARVAQTISQTASLARVEAVNQRAALLTTALIVGVALAVGLAGVLWIYARRRLVSRLGDVSRQIVAVARGTHDQPVPITGRDEIGRMEKALNILRRRSAEATRLQASLEEAVIARTGDLVREMQASDTARADAEAIARSKTELLALMSHEIRTPLNGIVGMLGLLAAETQDEEQAKRVQIAHRSARDLLDISNELLNFAASDDAENGPRDVHFLLRDLVGQLELQLRTLAAPKGLEATIELIEPAPHVLVGDVVKIRQILSNLISNAVKYTDAGRVSVLIDHGISEADGQIVLSITVADTGVGMSEAALAEAFDAYARATAARQSGIEGIGLGLAISRSLTTALGGALDVQSAPGVGSRFTLSVPLGLGDPDLIVREVDLDEAAFADPRRVLIIDDHAVNRLVARGYLEKMGCDVVEVATGRAGLAAVQDGPFDLVLIDLDLPDMSGQSVAEGLSDQPQAGRLVALTAHLIEDTEMERTRLGVSRILAKPISPRALADCLSDDLTTHADQPRETVSSDPVLETLLSDRVDLGEETTARIVAEFLTDLPNAIDRIRDAGADDGGSSDDLAAARRAAAHRLKGAASNFRLDALCDLMLRIEAGDEVSDAQLTTAAEAAARQLSEAATQSGLHVVAGSTNR